jgi:protein-tyrosine phosphatase
MSRAALARATRTPPAPFDVLVVCTANICRSPVAHSLLARALAGSGDVRVASAGLHARDGSPASEDMTRLFGDPLDGFTARQLTREMIEAADLVLVMTRDHRSAVVDAAPTAVRRTFTLREFADLAVLARQVKPTVVGGSAGERLAAFTTLAPRLRVRRAAGVDDDVADPYGRGEEAHLRALAEIQDAVAAIVGAAGADDAVSR